MPGLVPGIHVFHGGKTWMAGTSPAMTVGNGSTSMTPGISVSTPSTPAQLRAGVGGEKPEDHRRAERQRADGVIAERNIVGHQHRAVVPDQAQMHHRRREADAEA